MAQEMEMNQLMAPQAKPVGGSFSGTTMVCWSCHNQFTMPPGGGIAACPFCNAHNQMAGVAGPMMAQPVQQPMMQPVLMAQPIMAHPQPASNTVVVIAQPQAPAPAPRYAPVMYFRKNRNLCGTITMLYIAAVFVMMAIVTPGWRKVVYRGGTNYLNGTAATGGDSWTTTLGVGLYQYKASTPKLEGSESTPPIVGAGQTGTTIKIFANCVVGNFTFFSPPDCQSFHTLQGLGVATILVACLTPVVMHMAVGAEENEKKIISVRGMFFLIVAILALMVGMFVSSDQTNFQNLIPDPRYGEVTSNGYGFSFGFFCVGFAFNIFSSWIFMCSRRCDKC